MDEIEALNFPDEIDTRGTNWEFIGEKTAPSWLNKSTNHCLIIEYSDSEDEYSVKINHESQAQAWWVLSQVSFAAELIPLIEWLLSTPESVLYNRNGIMEALELFWEEDIIGKQSV